MKRKARDKEYSILVRLTFRGTVYIKATSEADAINQFNAGLWDSDDLRELVDWEITGPVEENE